MPPWADFARSESLTSILIITEDRGKNTEDARNIECRTSYENKLGVVFIFCEVYS